MAKDLHLQILLCPNWKPADGRVKSLQEDGQHQFCMPWCMLPWLLCLVQQRLASACMLAKGQTRGWVQLQ